MTCEHIEGGEIAIPLSKAGNMPAAAAEYVYFIGSVGGPIKIGRSINPQHRRNEMQVGNDRLLTLLATIPGGRELEAALHHRFALHRIRGEVFAATPELLMMIWEAAAGRPRQFNNQVSPNVLGQFLAANTRRDPMGRLRSSVAYEAFARWCEENDHSHWTQKAFSLAMKGAGFRSKASNGMHWLGLTLEVSDRGGE